MSRDSTKHEVRQRVLARLIRMEEEQRSRDSATLRAELQPELAGSRPLNIGIYIPLPHEVNLLPLLQEHPQHRYAVPRCLKGRQMEFRHISNPSTDTRPGAMGIPEPCTHLSIIPPEELDIIIVPGVAFTEHGNRLGYGGGYYDRYLPRCTNAKLIATAFAEQMLPELPTEAHDLRIPHIIHL
ncbi:MAG: 5-formyltetrahydrofolate cyclo-ligase [Akkermansia sp.]|nr:5-formyltetrahydrofolate cyclo-ligase [Akkermansia sp.]